MSTGIPITGPVTFSELALEFSVEGPTIDLLKLKPTIDELDRNVNNPVSISRFRGKKGGLYDFSTFTFTNAGKTGADGPTRDDLLDAYSYADWTQNVTNLDVNPQGYQLWTVPRNATYTLVVAGAGTGSATSGRGTVFTNTSGVSLLKGDKLVLIVGHQGFTGAGGGATFVYKNTVALSNLLVCCGGGGFQTSDASTGTGAFGGAGGGNGGGCTTSSGGAGGGPGVAGAKGANGKDGTNLAGEGGFGGLPGSAWNGNMAPKNVVSATVTLSGSFGGGAPPGRDGAPGWYSGGGGGGRGGGGGYQGGGGGGGGGGGNGCWGAGGAGGRGGGGSSYTSTTGSFTGWNTQNGYVTITRVV
jgi:hypothetical protein